MQHPSKRKTLALVVLSVVLAASTSFAASVTFDNRAQWAAAAGGGITTEGFTGMTWNSTGWPYPTLTTNDAFFSNGAENLYVAMPEFVPENGGPSPYQTSEFLGWWPSEDFDTGELIGRTLTITFNAPLKAVGWDFGTFFGGVTQFSFGLAGGSHTRSNAEASYTFFGVVSDTPFTEVTLQTLHNPYDDPFGELSGVIDDLSYAPAAGPVPEPSTFVLFGAGLAGGFLIRRRVKTQE